MPVLSGLDLMERLHDQADCPPIIVVTAFNTSVNRERGHRLGARVFFAKPIDDQALLDAIHWAIEEDDPVNREPQKQT
jgi:FixJ family two-component response regulator